jgi:hypothetical protein
MPVHTIQVPALVLRAGLGLVFPLLAESTGPILFFLPPASDFHAKDSVLLKVPISHFIASAHDSPLPVVDFFFPAHRPRRAARFRS